MSMYGIPKKEVELAEEMAKATMESFLPRSKATNAYDLLEEIIALILEEPLRYDQGSWFLSLTRNALDFIREDGNELPNCGTMACIAGWIVTVKRIPTTDVMEMPVEAAKVLGFNWPYAGAETSPSTRAIRDLFDDNLYEVRTEEEEDEHEMPKAGTVAYAELGVRKIRRFMAKYEDRLKAKVYDADPA